jgi:Sortase domain
LKLARNISRLTFLAGVVLFGAGYACGGGSDKPAVATATTEPPTATVTNTPTQTPTPAPPTATPTPFNGKVARFKYPRFGIDAPIEELGVDANLEMQTPKVENVDVGWYNTDLKPGSPFLGARPGWDGNAIFSAHVYYINRSVCPSNPLACPAPFQKLAQAAVDDDVVVTMDNGQEYHYKVISKTQYPAATIDMGKIISPPTRPAGKQWITMITCGGALDSTGLEYVSRDVVVAERVS